MAFNKTPGEIMNFLKMALLAVLACAALTAAPPRGFGWKAGH